MRIIASIVAAIGFYTVANEFLGSAFEEYRLHGLTADGDGYDPVTALEAFQVAGIYYLFACGAVVIAGRQAIVELSARLSQAKIM